MIRYTSFAGTIARIEPLGYGGYAIVTATRVPAPVRATLKRAHFGGITEVDWDPKTREAKIAPYWERRHM